MKFIFVTRRPSPPLFLGGAEITHNFLAEKLVEYGHEVIFIGSLIDPNYPTKERYDYYYNSLKNNKDVHFISENNDAICYSYRGINCLALSQENILSILKNLLAEREKIEAVITSLEGSSDIIKLVKSNSIKVIGWLHSSNTEGMEAIKGNPDVLLSTSEFIQKEATKYSKIKNCVFYPGFQSVQPLKKTGEALTFINPVQEKGADFVLSLAQKLPQQKFICVEGWYKNKDFYSKMGKNMQYFSPQKDMTTIWKKTKVLLVPSVVPEAFGRVIVEAHMYGIPVIAHNIGGIPEAMNGASGLINRLNIQDWISSIKEFSDIAYYKRSRIEAISAAQKFKRNIVDEFLTFVSLNNA